MIKMETAMKAFEKTGKISKLTENGSYRLTLYRQPEMEKEGQYLIEIHRVARKGEKAPEKPELAMRYDGLTRALSVANQALRGGLDQLLLFNKPPSDR
jgi:hypothetical protein